MEADLQKHLAQAQACIEQMQAALIEDRWDDIEPLDIQCRELLDSLISHYEEISDDDQKTFRTRVGDILSLHRQLLMDCENRLESLRTEISKTLKSDKMSRAYRDNL